MRDVEDIVPQFRFLVASFYFFIFGWLRNTVRGFESVYRRYVFTDCFRVLVGGYKAIIPLLICSVPRGGTVVSQMHLVGFDW